MAQTFKVLSLLLTYPTAELQEAATAFEEILEAEALLGSSDRTMLKPLIDELRTGDLYDLQERYVLLFDRTRSLSLHLFEHVHGESRDRGQAMVDLMALYERHGLTVDARELPDFVPLFLEFLSTQPTDDARELVTEPLHVITALRERLRKRGSIYAAVFFALEALARGNAPWEQVDALLDEPEVAPDDLEALDREWEDAAVHFAGAPDPSQGCQQANEILNRMVPTPADGASPGPRQQAS
ncbi:MAG: nitrate reductase molybdenum cofactor assembly chaperone [Rhodospirillales bacterium]|nr:nitrate reductase molybdenum cofactor assembly chaperone [Rhodospirillales bacterium]